MKNILHQSSQRAISIFTNDVFSLIYSYISILELKETQKESPTQTCRHSTVRQQICNISKFLNTIRENGISNQISQNGEHDLQKILVWFIITYFVQNVDLIALSRKKL